jgi:hypothetical protein
MNMTITADEKKRVLLPTAKPGEQFDLQIVGSNKIVLTRLKVESETPSEVTFIKKDGYTVGVTGQKVDPETLRQLLDEFP